MSAELVRQLRDEIVRLLREEIEESAAEEPATAEATDEPAGCARLMVIDGEANCYRVTVELI